MLKDADFNTFPAVYLVCGYTDLAYLKTLFKRRFGCTMRDWRAQNRTL